MWLIEEPPWVFFFRSNLISHRLWNLPELVISYLWLLFSTSDQSESSALFHVAEALSGDGFWFMTTLVQSGSERPLTDYARVLSLNLVAVDQRDKQKQRAESDGTCQYRLHQQNCPAAQEEDVYEQPADIETKSTTKNSQKLILTTFWASWQCHLVVWPGNNSLIPWGGVCIQSEEYESVRLTPLRKLCRHKEPVKQSQAVWSS